MSLKLAPCSSDAAKFAVERWHYSRKMPSGRLVRYGVWEDDEFTGAIIFGRGAARHLGTRYGLSQTEVVELVRIALRAHKTPVSKLISIAMKLLHKSSPGLKLVVSFADPREGHVGAVYQASNWIYTGTSDASPQYLYKGKWTHIRDLSGSSFGRPRKISLDDLKMLPKRIVPGKHRYLYPLTPEMREKVQHLARPYPKTSRTQAAEA